MMRFGRTSILTVYYHYSPTPPPATLQHHWTLWEFENWRERSRITLWITEGSYTTESRHILKEFVRALMSTICMCHSLQHTTAEQFPCWLFFLPLTAGLFTYKVTHVLVLHVNRFDIVGPFPYTGAPRRTTQMYVCNTSEPTWIKTRCLLLFTTGQRIVTKEGATDPCNAC